MKKFILALAAVFALTIFPANAFAAENSEVLYNEIGIFNARVYVCDDDAGTVILKSVDPFYLTSEMLSIAYEAEYTEIPIKESLIQIGSMFTDLKTVNGYMLDRDAVVVIGRNSKGLKILYMRFEQ